MRLRTSEWGDKDQIKKCFHFPVDPFVFVVNDLTPDIDRKAVNRNCCDGSKSKVAGQGELWQECDPHIAADHFQYQIRIVGFKKGAYLIY